jgi:hypothetical protein
MDASSSFALGGQTQANCQLFPTEVPWYAYGQRIGGLPMAIYRLLQNSPLGPEEIAILTDAYERTLRTLNLVDRNDPITQLIAGKIIELGQRGVRDAKKLTELAIKELGVE